MQSCAAKRNASSLTVRKQAACLTAYTPRGYTMHEKKKGRFMKEQSAKYKNTPRSTELQTDVTKRLNRAIGQLNAVKTMIEENRYCGDVLTQLAAAESAVRRVSEMLLQEHLQTCVVEEIRNGNDDVVDEAMALIRRFL